MVDIIGRKEGKKEERKKERKKEERKKEEGILGKAPKGIPPLKTHRFIVRGAPLHLFLAVGFRIITRPICF